MAIAHVGLGSNVGDRSDYLDRAVAALRGAGVAVRRRSAARETAPVGGPPQGTFLNAAVELETDLSARDLLALLKRVERELGRTPGPRWGPREIDLDLLLYEDSAIRGEGIEVPHPRMAERAFVLEPLAEIAPDRVHPPTGRTVAELLEDLRRSRRREGSCDGSRPGKS